MKFLIFTLILFSFYSCKEESKKHGEVEIKFKKSNSGHRLGGDITKVYEENTIEILNLMVNAEIYKHKSFKYWEFDVRETKDNVLVVHHDRELKNGKKIDLLTYNELSKHSLRNGEKIPLYSDIMDLLCKNYGHVVVEIKSLISDKGRLELIKLFDKYAIDGSGSCKLKTWRYLAFKKKFKKSFPKKTRKFYCKKMKNVMKAGFHRTNLCKKYL